MRDVLQLVPDLNPQLKQFMYDCVCVVYAILTVNTGLTGVKTANPVQPSQLLERTLGEICTFAQQHTKYPWYYIMIPKLKMKLGIAKYQGRLRDILGKFNLDKDIPFHVLAQRCYEGQAPNTRSPHEGASEQRPPVQILGPDDLDISANGGLGSNTTPAFAMPRSQFQGDLSCTNVQGNHSTMHIQHATIYYISPQNLEVEQLATIASSEAKGAGNSETPIRRRQHSCPPVPTRRSPFTDGDVPHSYDDESC